MLSRLRSLYATPHPTCASSLSNTWLPVFFPLFGLLRASLGGVVDADAKERLTAEVGARVSKHCVAKGAVRSAVSGILLGSFAGS